MNKIQLTEKELYNIINESVYRILNEETDEGIFRDIKNGAKAFGNSITKGGNIRAHYNNLQYQDSKNDINKYDNKYRKKNIDVTQNTNNIKNQYYKQNIEQMQPKIDKLEQQIDKLKQQIETIYTKAKEKAQQQAEKARNGRKELNQQRDDYRKNFNKLKNANPYA